MGRLPDRFDLWLLKARECPEPARQVDYILGALIGLKEWWLLNVGTKEKPVAAKTEIEGGLGVLVFSDVGRLEEFLEGREGFGHAFEAPPTISIPSPGALKWCVDSQVGLIVNPDEEGGTVLIPFEQIKAFFNEWTQRGGAQAAGFWIPNMTSEEEDFWQGHGI